MKKFKLNLDHRKGSLFFQENRKWISFYIFNTSINSWYIKKKEKKYYTWWYNKTKN